jgi:branched-chain amino acid transport system permease protein
MNYALHLGVLVAIYALLAFSLNLLVGLGGLLALCGAAFYGLGAYFYALASLQLGWSFPAACAGAILGPSLVAGLVAFPMLKFRGDRFVLATMALQAIVYAVLKNWSGLTRGPLGISGIPRPGLFGAEVRSPMAYFALVGLVALVVGGFLVRLYGTRLGLCLRALRDDERAAVAMGVDAALFYRVAFVLAAAVSGLCGALYASYITFIDPNSFTLNESILQVSIVLIGGGGRSSGPFWGACLVVLLPQALSFVGLPDVVAANLREMTFGFVLVTLMFLRPRGLAGEAIPR